MNVDDFLNMLGDRAKYPLQLRGEKVGRVMDAEALKAHVTELLEQARRISMFGVNWGDLRVVDIETRKSLLTGDERVVVMVEEAAPDSGLAAWIAERIDRERFGTVEVETEW